MTNLYPVLFRLGAAPAGFRPEAEALFARRQSLGVATDSARRALDAALIDTLASAGVWAKLRFFLMFAAPGAASALIDWTANHHDPASQGAPAFEADRGLSFMAVGDRLLSPYNPALDTAVSVGDIAAGVYARTDGDATGYWDLSAYDDRVPSALTISVKYDSDATGRGIVASNSEQNWAFGAAGDGSVRGSSIVSALGGTRAAYRNGASAYAAAVVSAAAKPDCGIGIGDGRLVNSGGTPGWNGAPCRRQLAYAFVSRGLSSVEAASLHAACETYLDALGAGVVA